MTTEIQHMRPTRDRTADSWPRHKQKARKRNATRKFTARAAQDERDRNADRRL